MSGPVVSLSGVRKSYGSTKALTAVDLELHRGVIGLLGPNGAGKTTLLRLVATAMPPSAGRIVVCGQDTTATVAGRTQARRSLGYLPQEVSFPRGMTVFGFLDYVGVLKEWSARHDRHREVARVLELVDLRDRARKRISVLSGGQRRRLALAQALLGRPELLVLDEPTTGLDPEQRASLRATLSACADRGTVLLATHQTEDVAALCDRVIVLDGGRVVYDGTVDDFVQTATGEVWVGPQANDGAFAFWRTGGGALRSVGGTPLPGAAPAEPGVEDAYLLLRHRNSEHSEVGA